MSVLPWGACHRLLTIAMAVMVSLCLSSQVRSDQVTLLDAAEYRTSLEEVVVVGKQLPWRKDPEPDSWRAEKFSLPELPVTSRMEWLPKYTKEERDQYDGVRDRTAENPEFKLFEWKF